MNTRILGSHYQVTMDKREVYAFAKRWPCCKVKVKPTTFLFHARTGDLVSTNNAGDAPEFLALAHAAQEAGIFALRNGLTVCWRRTARE